MPKEKEGDDPLFDSDEPEADEKSVEVEVEEEREVEAPAAVAAAPKRPKPPKPKQLAKLDKVFMSDAEWDAIHSEDPLSVYALRRIERPYVPLDIENCHPLLRTPLGPNGAPHWREDSPCPACKAIVTVLHSEPRERGGSLVCLGCGNTLGFIESEIARLAKTLKKGA